MFTINPRYQKWYSVYKRSFRISNTLGGQKLPFYLMFFAPRSSKNEDKSHQPCRMLYY
jgi:hypothetical protein